MGIFTDLFSTKPAEDAAAAKQAGYQNGYEALGGQYNAGRGALATDFGAGQNALTSNINQGQGAIASNYGNARDAINSGYGTGRDAINQGYNDASALYQPLVASTGRGAAAYGDATGANGADGIARAGSQFKSITGYNGGLDTGIDATNRLAAAHGGFGAGNNSADVIKFASDYDNNHYQNYLQGLSPYLSQNASAVANNANLDVQHGAALNASNVGQGTALGSNYDAQGNLINADYGQLGTGLNANFGALGSGTNASYMSQGGAANASATGQGNAAADAKLAPYQASSNFWNGLMGAGKLAVSAFTGGAGGGGGATFSGPSYGGGNVLSGDAYGGSSSSPLPGLSPSDYGAGY